MDYYSYRPDHHPRYSFIIKYPKFLLLFITIIAAYILFNGKTYPPLHNFLFSLNHFGSFISGMMYSYGFTAAPSVAIFLILAEKNSIWLTAIFGGVGSLAADYILFWLFRTSFNDEIKKFSNEKWMIYIRHFMPKKIKKWFLPVLACIIIASPAPDELGIALFAASKHVSTLAFSWLAFILNTVGIYVVLLIGSQI